MPGAYDPETKLYIFGTGNPTPAYTTGTRGEGDNLFTCSLVAVNVDTGKMAWYFQTSPHDMHDWDSAQTPVLIDGVIDGKPRKLVSTAARNGYFFTLDRVTGERHRHQQVRHWRPTGRRASTSTGSVGATRRRTRPFPARSSRRPRTARSTGSRPRTRPDPASFYVPRGQQLLHLLPDRRRPARLHGPRRQGGSRASAPAGTFLTAIDYKTGKIAWRQPFTGMAAAAGLLTTAGGLLFAGDGGGNFVAHDAANGKPLWHSRIGNVTNAPQTFQVDGKQYVVVATGDTLWAFVMH